MRIAGNILSGRQWSTHEDLTEADIRAGRLAVKLAWFVAEEVRRTAPPEESLFTGTAQNAQGMRAELDL
jgi:hypothetical protein